MRAFIESIGNSLIGAREDDMRVLNHFGIGNIFTSTTIVLCAIAIWNASPASGQGLSNNCLFVTGPRAGQTQRYPGVPPIQLGTPCNDGVASVGYAIPDSGPDDDFYISSDGPVCYDILGTRVDYLTSENIPKAGLATVAGPRPVIYMKTSVTSALHPSLRELLEAHECGHHATGQVVKSLVLGTPLGREDELEADCYALSALDREDLLSSDDQEVIFDYISTLPADAANYSGPERVERMRACLP